MQFSAILAYLAFTGAIASWIAGAVFTAGAGAGPLAIIAWPFALGRIRAGGGEPATLVNKALVAFIACMLIGIAAYSASANLYRFAK